MFPDTSNSREIRVFLSSTFRDMEAERNYLMTSVFPDIRRYCTERQVSFTEIDLRWGITEEESKQGKAVEICLDEINRCRKHPPFFIGFLGERYGWIPLQQDLAGWLSDNNDSLYASEIHDALAQGISVTELEMQYAFLNEAQPADHSRVFLRAAEKTQQLSQKAGNQDDFYDAANGKLAALKGKLRASSCISIDGYTSIKEFGDSVRQYLIAAIDRLYPQDTLLSAADMQARAHSNYAASRRKAYVPLTETRVSVLADIETASRNEDAKQKIVITGKSGRGKSAFLADLESQLTNKGWVFSHYTGADGNRSLDSWLSRLIDALEITGQLISDIPGDRDGQWQAIYTALLEVQAGLSTPIYLLVDAVNQFTEADAFKTLSQLKLPTGVVLIVTTTQTVNDNSWLIHELPALNAQNRQRAIESFLSDFRKDLPEELDQSIAQHTATAEPLFLRLLLEELRLHARHETLTSLTQQLLSTQDASGLFASVLATMNRDHQRSTHSELASQTVSLLAASRRGLHYEDLAKLLANDTDPEDPADNQPRLPDYILSPLLAKLEVFCLRDDGRMYIMHDALLAVAQRNPKRLTESRLQLVEHFADNTGYAVAERVHQYTALEDTDKLVQTLGDLDATLALWVYDELLLRAALSALGAGLSEQKQEIKKLVSSWVEKIKQYKALPKFVDEFGNWIRSNAYYGLLEAYLKELLSWKGQSSDAGKLDIAISLNNLADLYYLQNHWDEAEPLYLEALEISQTALPAGHPYIARVLNNLAELYRAQNRWDEAEPLYLQALEINQTTLPGTHPSIALSLNNLAELYRAQNCLDEAELLYLQALEIAQEALPAGHPDIASYLACLATLYHTQIRLDEAEPLCLQALEIKQAALPAGHPDIAASLNCLAGLYKTQNRLDEAEPLYLQALEIRQAGLPAGHPDIAISLKNLAGLYESQGRLDEAEPLYLQALEISKAALPAEHPDIAIYLNSLAALYWFQGRLDEAEPLYLQALEIRQAALPAGHLSIASSLNNLAVLYEYQCRLDEAESLFLQALEINQAELSAGHPDLAINLHSLAQLYAAQNRWDKAEPLYLKMLEVTQKALQVVPPYIAFSLSNLAVVYESQGRWDEAEPLYLQALQIVQAALPAGHPHIASSLKNLAELYKAQNRWDEAEPLYLQALQIVQAAIPAGHPDVASILNGLAGLYYLQNRWDETELLYLKLVEIMQATRPAGHPDIATSVHNLAELYRAQNRWDEAEPLYLQALEVRQAALPAEYSDTVIAKLYRAFYPLDEAEQLYRQELKIREDEISTGHRDIANSLSSLAGLYYLQNRLDEAVPLYRQALEIWQAALPAGHPVIASSLNNLAVLYYSQMRWDEAEPLYLQALEIRQAALPAGHPDIADSLNDLALLYCSQNRWDEAEPLYLQALEIRQAALPAGHPDIADSLNNLAGLYKAQNRWDKVELLYLKAQELN